MAILKTDNWDGTYDGGFQSIRAFVDATVAIAAGDWMAVYPGAVAAPGGVDGEEYRIADSDNAGASYDVVGVALQALASGTGFIDIQISGRYVGANVDSGASVANGDPLCIGATAGRAVENIFDASTTANRRTIAMCRSTPSANTATVDIVRHPRWSGP